MAQALANLLAHPQYSRTLNLPGPSTLSYEYLLDLVSSVTLNPPSRAPVVPKAIAMAFAKVAQSVWWPALSPDEVTRRYINDSTAAGDWESSRRAAVRNRDACDHVPPPLPFCVSGFNPLFVACSAANIYAAVQGEFSSPHRVTRTSVGRRCKSAYEK